MGDYLKEFLQNHDKLEQGLSTSSIEGTNSIDSKYQSSARRTDPNEYAALNQTKLDIAGNILARGIGTFVTGTLGTVAMLHDIPKSVFKAVTGDSDKHEGWDYYMNNSINADLSEAQEYVMKEFPLYDTYKDSKTPFTTKKILDGITQGAAFIGVGYAGGWLTKGILQSAKLLGNSQKLINFTNKTGKSLAVDNAVYAQINNYLDKGKNVGAAIYNRSFESMLEAKGTGQEIREKLESENQEAFDSTGQYLYNPEDIDNRVRQAEKLNFGFNLALGVIDAYQNLKIFDGFESKIGKAISKNIDDVTENVLSNKNLSKFGLPKVGATIVKYGTKSGALSTTGGLEALEELAQFSSNKLSQDLATNNYTKDDWDNLPKLITGIVGQMTDDIQNDPNAQFSALIGGLVGLPMGMVAKRSEDKQEALKSKQREIAQQSLIEKNVLVGLYKIKNGKTLEDKVSGEIQTRFSNHQGFQNSVINQINADNFEGLISHLENIKETSIDDLKELEIGVKTDSKGNIIQPSTIINEAIEQAKSVKKVYENVNLANANKSELIRNNITNLILNGKYFDKKIDLVTNELETKKAEILAKITKDQNYAEKAFKTIKSKETGKEDLSFFVNGEIKNANIEELDINPETKDEIIKLKEELKQLNKEREFTIKEYNKYREPSYVGKVEKEAQKNIENLEKPIEQPVENTTVNSVEKLVVTNENTTKESVVGTSTDTTKDGKKIQYNSLLNDKKAYEYHLKNAKTPEDKLKIEKAILDIEKQLKQFSEYSPVDKNVSEKVSDNLTYLQDTYDKFKNNIKNASINKLYYILEKIRENYKLSQKALSQLKLEELQGNPPTQEDYDIVMSIQKINKSKLDLVEELIVKHEIEEENKKLKEPLLIEEFSTSTGEIKFALRQKEIEQAFKQNTVQDISEDGRVFNINDKQYRVGYSDMLMAINRNVNGDIISVELLNDKNETVTFRSQPLLDEIVFNILATKLTSKDFTSEIEVDDETLSKIENKIQTNDETELENDLIEIQELINHLEEVIEFEKNEFVEAGFSKKEVKEYINQSKNYNTLQVLKEVEKEILKQIKVLNKPVKIKTVKEKVKKIAIKIPIVKKEKITKTQNNDDITTETGNVTSETSEGIIEQIIEGEEQNNAKLSSETEVNKSTDTSTDNTYYEAPDTFLSASEANAEDIFIPENLVEELPTNSSEELSDEIKATKKVKDIPENPKLKYKTFDSNEPMFVNKEFMYFDGKTYTSYKFDEQAASTIIKDSDLVLKPLTNNGFGSIGVFTTGKEGKLVSILRQELNNKDRRVGSPTYGLDEGETGTGFLTSKKTQELFEEFFGQAFENGGKLKDINKRGKLKEKPEKAFNVSFNSLNIGSPTTVTLKPTVETVLSKNIHYDSNGVPTIVRLKGKGVIEPVIITGDVSIPVDKIQLSKENKVGDTILLFTERDAHNNPDKQVYPAVPVTVKSIGETNNFSKKVVSLLNETVINIQEHIKEGKEGKINETVSKSNDLVIENLYKEIKNIIRLGDGTVNLKRNKNNSKTFILEGVFVIDKLNKKTETIEVTITKDSIVGLEEFKDKLMKVIPSFSVESIQALKESDKFHVNDYLEAMTIAVKEDQPIKGVSIEIFTGSNKKDVIPSMTIKKKLTSNDLTFKDTDDLNSLLNLEVAQKTSDEKPTTQNTLQDIGDNLINEEIVLEKTSEKVNSNLLNTKSDKKINFKKEINKLIENISDNDLFNIDEFINNSTHMEDSIRLSAIKDYLKGDENALIEGCK